MVQKVTTSDTTNTTTIDYFSAAGRLMAETVNGANDSLNGLIYLVANDQGSPRAALDRIKGRVWCIRGAPNVARPRPK